jgi:hypothetical protein
MELAEEKALENIRLTQKCWTFLFVFVCVFVYQTKLLTVLLKKSPLADNL